MVPIEVNNIYALLAVLIVAVAQLTIAILGFVQARRAASKANETHIQLQAVEKATNGMKDQLVETTRQAALAAGIAQGKDLERAKIDAETLAKEGKK